MNNNSNRRDEIYDVAVEMMQEHYKTEVDPFLVVLVIEAIQDLTTAVEAVATILEHNQSL